MFAGSYVFAATKLADLAVILPAVLDHKAEIYDVDGREYFYNSEKNYIAPTIMGHKVSKKAFLERALTCSNMGSLDFPMRTKSLVPAPI